MDAYGTYTPLDPEIPENQMMLKLAFINQAAQILKGNFSSITDLKVKILS